MTLPVRSHSPDSPSPAFGALLREWRQRRHLSQLALALEAGVSQRHLSFVESGRARPSREMVLQLAVHLDVPLRGRNGLLLAAGYAPVFSERPLDDPTLAAARRAVERVLAGARALPRARGRSALDARRREPRRRAVPRSASRPSCSRLR